MPKTLESTSIDFLPVDLFEGGGWQDQVGGLLPGFKYTTCANQLPIKIDCELVQIESDFESDVNDRLLLVYTGVTRLAKDLLLNCLRNWYTISQRIFTNVEDLVSNGRACAEALRTGRAVIFFLLVPYTN
jgi:fucokinase